MNWNRMLSGAVVVLLLQGRSLAADAFQSGSRLKDPLKQLVLDRRVIAETQGVRLALGQVRKEPRNPLFQADRPWENALNNLYPNVVFDEEERRFKLWYKCVLADTNSAAKLSPPNLINGVGWLLCYATSRDGLAWDKPELGLQSFDGSTQNNAVARDVANAGIFKDLHDPDPARRYKLIYDVGVGQLRVRFSPDGLHWGAPLAPKGFGSRNGDTHNNAFWDERLGNYVLSTRLYPGERLVARFESSDFLNWKNSGVVLRSTPAEGKLCQTYCLSMFPYANGYLGFVMMYKAGSDRTVACELAWSADSVAWERIAPGVPFIPRGPANSYDSGCIYAQAGPPAVKDGQLWVYYGGSREVHRGWKRHCLPCLARVRLDGFAGYEPVAADQPGTLLTQPLRCVADDLRVSADVRGALRAGLAGVAGYGLDDCEPVRTDATDRVIRWKGGRTLAGLKGTTVQIQFQLDDAKLYAFSGVELPATADRK
jgi:hypothetical protein